MSNIELKHLLSSLFLVLSLGGCPGEAHAQDESMQPQLESAVALYRKDGPEAALPEFLRLNESYKASGNRLHEAISLGYIGESYWRLGEFEKAREHLEGALAMKQALADRKEEADTLNVLGLLEWEMGNFDEAIANFRMAGAIGHELGDRKLEGMALNNLSLVLDDLGDYQSAVAQYQEVLDIYGQIDFPRGMGDTLGNIGGTHLLLGHYLKALGYYQQALKISEQLGSAISLSQDHGNIALSYLGLGEVERAMDHFDVAIEAARKSGLRLDEAYWISSKGSALVQQGRYDLGLESHRAALAIYEQTDAKGELIEAMYEMGLLLSMLGDPVSAEGYFEQAMNLAREIRQSRGITLNLLALGDLYYRRSRLDDAEKLFEEARDRSRETGQQSTLASSLLKLALIFRDQEKPGQAIQSARQANHIAQEIGARPLEAEALYILADLERRAGRLEASLKEFSAAQSVLGETASPELMWQIQFGRAQVQEAMGELEAAVGSLTEAVRIIEGVRDRLQENRFRTGYLQDKYLVYVELVRLQLELGKDEEAFSTAERLRARSFANLTDRGVRSSLSEDQRQMESELRERIQQLQDYLVREQIQEKAEQRQIAIENFSRELLLAEQDYQAFLDDHAFSGHAQRSNRYTQSSIEIRNLLRNGDVMIEYVVGERGVMIFVLTTDAMYTVISPVSRTNLNSRVALLRDLARRAGDDRWQNPASSLTAALLEPLAKAGWLEGAEQIFLVPHDILNYLPFAMLPAPFSRGAPDQARLLLEDYKLVYLPTAFALNIGKQETEQEGSMLVMAPSGSRLQYAPEEARAIDAIFRPHSQLLAGTDAKESRFKELADEFNSLHFATHGYFNKFNPLLSGLELEADEFDDGLLEVHEILELDLNASLVTLSACQTALGSGYLAEMPAGDDFVGLTRAFLSAGSHSVLATLWEVDDRSTIQLMLRFYRMLTDPEGSGDPAAALVSAQRDLRASTRFQHPYYWAPFVMVGGSATRQVSQGQATGEIL